MPYKLLVNMPNLAEGAELYVDGLGVFSVGGENSISDEVARQFEATHGVVQEPAYATNEDTGEQEQVGVSNVQKSITELINGQNGLSVVEVDSSEAVTETVEPEQTNSDSNTPVTPVGFPDVSTGGGTTDWGGVNA